MLARIATKEFAAGMLTDRGRVLEVTGDSARVATVEGVSDVPLTDLSVDLSDRATWWLTLDVVATRTGLDATAGLLWSVQDDPMGDELAWVLESSEESRSRPHDTDDPVDSLARALTDTAKD